MNIMKYSAVRTTTMMYTLTRVHVGNWQAYHQIIDGLFLGMIPIKKASIFGTEFDDQHKKIRQLAEQKNPVRPLKLVVSVVEPDELQGVGFSNIQSMVSPRDWNDQKVEQHLLSIADQTAIVNNDDAIATIFKMRKCIMENGSVYVHCKAGRSRSAMICLIYLVVYENMTIQAAKELLIRKRKQVELGTAKLEKAAEIIREIKHRIRNEIKNIADIKADKPLDCIMDYVTGEIPQPIKKSPNHIAGFFAGLASMIAAPVAWIYGAYKFGAEKRLEHNSLGWGIAAGLVAFIFAPLGWIYGGVRIGQNVAANSASIPQLTVATKPDIKIKPIVLPKAASMPKKSCTAKDDSKKQYDPRSSNIHRKSPLFSMVKYGYYTPVSPDSSLTLRL